MIRETAADPKPRGASGCRAAWRARIAVLATAACLPLGCDVPGPSGGEAGGGPAPDTVLASDTTFEPLVPVEGERGPRSQPGTAMGIYAPEQHALYDGRFVITGSRVHQVGSLSDEPPWDHMGDDGATARPVEGTVEIDVDEITNTGSFRADLQLPEGRYVVEIERFRETSPCQDGGIAAFLFEHGDSGCGDDLWPKSLLYVAGWGVGDVTLDDEPLHEDYEIHFMVTQGMRHRETLAVASTNGGARAGAVNPAAMQLDFYVRSPGTNEDNHPPREVFDHFFAMEVTWR